MKRVFMLACGALFVVAAYSASAAAKIQIGVVGPMSGTYSVFGRQMRRGAQMAVDEINAAGGVNGEQLMLTIGDDRCDAGRAVRAADEMAAKKVALVVGHFCSGASLAASRVYARDKIIQISPASTNPVFTERRPGPGVFRVIPNDRKQGAFAGAYIASKFAGKKIALVRDNGDYGTYLTEEARKVLDAAAQPPVLIEGYSEGHKGFSALVAKLKAAGVEVVYAGGYYPEIALLVREMRKQGMTAQLIAGDALVTQEFWRAAGRAGEGTLMSFAADPRENTAAAGIVKKTEPVKWNPWVIRFILMWR